MCVLLEARVKHPRPISYGHKVGIVGRLRLWIPAPATGENRPAAIVIETVFQAASYRQAAAKALWLLHGRLPWYSWKAEDLGRRRVRT